MSIYMKFFIGVTLLLFIVGIILTIYSIYLTRNNFTKNVMLNINNILNYNIELLCSPECGFSKIRIYDDEKKLNIFISRLGDGKLRFVQQLDKSARPELIELSNIGKELDIATNVNENSEGVLFSAVISGAQDTKLFLRKVLTELFGFQPEQELWVKHQLRRKVNTVRSR